MKFKLIVFLIISIGIFVACTGEEIDDEKPVIDMSFPTAVPNNCDTFYIADTFIFRAIFTDNVELGSFSLDIHHNFDHHTHSTDMVTCPMEPKKIPVNPFVFIRAFEIPAGLQKYEATVEITVPAGFDTGEYHLFIRLTDKAGWQTVRGINIKGLNKTKQF